MKTQYLKKWLCAMLAALMMLTACGSLAEPAGTVLQGQLTAEDLAAFGAKAAVHNGRVTFVDGACTADPVKDMDGAKRVVNSMLALTGGDEQTRFEPWRTLTDAKGNHYYVFQQVYAGTTVPGGAVKVVTDARDHMLGFVASVESGLPDTAEAEGITAGQAEELVLEHLREADQAQAELAEGRTERIILPVKPDIDPESTDEAEDARCRYVWAVYTTNTEEKNAERPYLAHYVTMDGTYLYSLQTILPGDEAGTAGYDAAYLFENMEPAEYTGRVTLSDGTEQEITVTLMRSTVTGKYYLGNLERRIAVADCYEFVYEKGHVVPVESEDNTGWDNTSLLSLYNYCKAWDYYHAIGWNGGDGLGTPILILKDYCNRNHQPVDNAAYAGKYYGWQVFLSSSANDLSQCLDVLAHEFTHCVTGSVMTFNAYLNDFGAINEAMSDIQGNICEMMAGATEDTSWLLGENSSGPAARSMSDPHKFGQPEFSWDLYYKPKVQSPTLLNDRGGVHSNSSLLSSVAYRLCEKGGMALEEARDFWFAVDCAMVPGTDYAQLSELLPWVLKNQGMEAYGAALEAATDAARLRSDEMPEMLDGDRAMVTLTLPDDERFSDGNWALMILSVDTEGLSRRVRDVLARKGEYTTVLDDLMVLAGLDPAALPTEREIAEDPEHAWDRTAAEIGKLADRQGNGEGSGLSGVMESVREVFSDLVYFGQVAAGQDGRTIRIVCRPGRTVPVLYRMDIDQEMNIKSVGLAVYAFGTWTDLGSIIATRTQQVADEAKNVLKDPGTAGQKTEPDFSRLTDLIGAGEPTGTGETEQTVPDLSWIGDLLNTGDSTGPEAGGFLGKIGSGVLKFGWNMLKELLFWKIRPAENNVLPSYGLASVAVLDEEHYPIMKDLLALPDLLEEA